MKSHRHSISDLRSLIDDISDNDELITRAMIVLQALLDASCDPREP